MGNPEEHDSGFSEEIEIFQREIDRQRALEQMDTPTSTDNKPLWVKLVVMAVFLIAAFALFFILSGI